MIDYRAELIAKAIAITDKAVASGEPFNWFAPSHCLMGHYRRHMSENEPGYGFPHMTEREDLMFLSRECDAVRKDGPLLAGDDWAGIRERLMEKWGILVV